MPVYRDFTLHMTLNNFFMKKDIKKITELLIIRYLATRIQKTYMIFTTDFSIKKNFLNNLFGNLNDGFPISFFPALVTST